MWAISFELSIFPKAYASPSRLGDLKISMYNTDDRTFPQLKCKAAETRHLCMPLRDAFKAFMSADNVQHKQILLMLELCVKIEAILDRWSGEFVLPPDAANELNRSIVGFVQLNTSLGHHFHPKNIVLFNMTIKFHYMLHIGKTAHKMHPKLSWCYMGEDFMRKIKQVIQSSNRGAAAQTIQPKAMAKYAQGLGMTMAGGQWRR